MDTCALMRLFDQQHQVRVRAESRAVEKFLAFALRGTVNWIASDVLEAEIQNNPDFDLRFEALELLAFASEHLIVSEDSFRRAADLERLGYGAFDALHLACAEQARADYLITTDDRFMRQIRRDLGKPRIQVENPVQWTKGWKS